MNVTANMRGGGWILWEPESTARYYYFANILSVNRFVDFPYEKLRKRIAQMFMPE